METRIRGVLSPKASGSITITENGNYDVVDVANAIVNVVPEEVGGITPEGSITLTSNGVYDVTMYAEAVVDVENVIPEGYVKPSGTLNVTSNGTFDVTEKKNVSVNVPQPSGTIEITENGEHDVSDYAIANVNVVDENGKDAFDCLQKIISDKYNFSFSQTTITKLPDGLDFSIATYGSSYFSGCSKLEKVGYINSSNITQFNDFFNGCSSLKIIERIDTSKGNTCSYMYYGCSKLETLPYMNLINCTTLSRMCQNCSSLKEVPNLNTIKVNNFNGTFMYCSSLETINGLDLISATNVSMLFDGCSNLKNLVLYNIKTSLQIGAWGNLLTLESLLHTIKELIDTGSSKTLTMGSANLSKLANVYVRIISTEPDENGNVKLPFEVCESTDEGAMLITNYVSLKNWSLA